MRRLLPCLVKENRKTAEVLGIKHPWWKACFSTREWVQRGTRSVGRRPGMGFVPKPRRSVRGADNDGRPEAGGGSVGYTSSAEFCSERSTRIVSPSPRKNQKKDMSFASEISGSEKILVECVFLPQNIVSGKMLPSSGAAFRTRFHHAGRVVARRTGENREGGKRPVHSMKTGQQGTGIFAQIVLGPHKHLAIAPSRSIDRLRER